MFVDNTYIQQSSHNYPYRSNFVEVNGHKIHYVEEGNGQPIIFLHGNPTWSYLWRNILPFTSKYGRAIAVDNIGFGKSDSPDMDFTMEAHSLYFENFIKTLGLENIILVMHDYGAVPGLRYASLNENNVRGLIFMECAAAPIIPASYEDMPEDLVNLYRTWRNPVTGPQLLIKQNQFIEEVMPQLVIKELSDEIMKAYREPFQEIERRQAIIGWEKEVPIDGEPEHTKKFVEAYNQWFTTTDIPKLLIYASPGCFVTQKIVEWYIKNLNNLETAYVGLGIHYIQEDQPEAIGRAISDWLRRLLITFD